MDPMKENNKSKSLLSCCYESLHCSKLLQLLPYLALCTASGFIFHKNLEHYLARRSTMKTTTVKEQLTCHIAPPLLHRLQSIDGIMTKLLEAVCDRVQNKTNTIPNSYGLQFPKSLTEKNQEKISFHQLNYNKRFISNRSTIQVWEDRDF